MLGSLQQCKAGEAVLLEGRVNVCQLAYDFSNSNLAVMCPDKFMKAVNVLAEHQSCMPHAMWHAIATRQMKIEMDAVKNETGKPEVAVSRMVELMKGMCFWTEPAKASKKFDVTNPTFASLFKALHLSEGSSNSPDDKDKSAAFEALFETETSKPEVSVAEQTEDVKAHRHRLIIMIITDIVEL